MTSLGDILHIANLLEVDTAELYEQAPCAYLSTLPDGIIIKVNTTFLEWTGYKRETLIGKKRFQELLPVAGKVFYDTHFTPLLLMQGFVKELALELQSSNSTPLPVLLNARLKRDNSGTPSLFRMAFLDTRGRHAYEEELRQAKRRAEDAESALKQLNETLEERIAEKTAERDRIWRMSQDILVVMSTQGSFVSYNPAFSRTLGWSPQEMECMSLADLAHPEQAREFSEILRRLAAGLPISRHKIRMRHKNGSYRWLSWTATPEGELVYAIGRDVTEDRKQAEMLRETEEALRQSQKMEAIGQLTGGIAHDFNNLLAGIAGNLQLIRLRRNQDLSTDISKYLDSAESTVKRAAALTHRLLAFSRRQALDPKPTNPNQLVMSMVELMERTVGPAVRIETMLEQNAWNTLCDANQLENALLNLAINARDAMPDGGTITIKTSNTTFAEDAILPKEAKPGNYVSISLADTGVGMSAEIMARAFEPFFTTKPPSHGTGLGLSMIFGFVRQSGGCIELDSAPGAGTRVKLHLPMFAGVMEQNAALPVAAESATGPAHSSILLVDDEAYLRLLLAELLENLGYTVRQASNAIEAMEILKSGQPIDLLISDIGLPGQTNGRQLADTARRDRPELKVMLITGYAEHGLSGCSGGKTAMQILSKPFELKEFAAKVSSLLQQKSDPFVHHKNIG